MEGKLGIRALIYNSVSSEKSKEQSIQPILTRIYRGKITYRLMNDWTENIFTKERAVSKFFKKIL